MGAAKYNRRVQMLTRTTSTNAFNETVQGWTPGGYLYAQHMPASDGERFKTGQVQATVSDRFIVRALGAALDLTTLDRLRFKGCDHEIVGVKLAEGGAVDLEISTKAVV